MKTKKVFVTLALGSLLAVGAFAGVKFANGFAEAKADEPTTRKIYLNPGIWDKGAGEKYYGWLFGGTTADQWYTFTTDGDYYSAEVANDYTKVIFLRSGPEMEPGWTKDTNFWNRTGDETFGENDLFTVSAWGDYCTGAWSVYDPTPVEHTYGLVGTFNGWDAENALEMTIDGNKATYNELVLAAGDALKLVKDNSWTNAKGYDSLIEASKNYFDRGTDLGDNNMIAKADGKYSFEYTISSSEIKVSFEAVELEYYVSVDGGEDVELVYDSDIEDNEHTVIGKQYKAKVTVDAGSELTFKKGSSAVKPGASDGDGTNNLFYKNDNKKITALLPGAELDLYFKAYNDGGYDTYLTGYTAAPNTYYFTNNKGWEGTPRYYAFNDNETPLAEWPGTEMTFVDIDGYGQNRYSFEVDDVKYPNFIIAKNDGTDQTIDLSFKDLSYDGLYLDEQDSEKENHWTVGEYAYAPTEYTLTVGETEIPLEHSEGTEYVAHNVDVLAKNVIGFEVDGVECATSTAKVINNNNLNEFKKVLVDADDVDVYVDVVAETIWVGGLPDDGYHFIKNGRTLVQLTPDGEYDGYTQYKSEMLSFVEGDTIEMINTSAGSGKLPVIFHDAEIEEVGLGDKFETVDDIITCKEDVSARVFLKLRIDGNKVYFGEVEQYIQDAIDYVNGFKAALATACGVENDKKDTVEAAWALQSTAYKALTKEAKDEVKLGGYSSVDEIKEFGERYLSILEQHSDWTLENFLEWEIPAGSNSFEVNYDSTVILVVAISSAATLCGLALFLAIKKRKHQ